MAQVRICDRSGETLPLEQQAGTVFLRLKAPRDDEGNPLQFKGVELQDIEIGINPEDPGIDLGVKGYATIFNTVVQRFGVGNIADMEPLRIVERKSKAK